VEERCTCGAVLPPDARFCHRCGRPLPGTEPVPEPEEQGAGEPAADPIPVLILTGKPAPQPDINFRNGAAVRVGFLAAALAQMVVTLTSAAGAGILLPVVLLAGGAYAVVLYRRRTGVGLSVIAGARIGWITGVFSFLITTVLFTLAMAMLAASDQLLKAWRESATSFGLPAEAADQIQKLMDNPPVFIMTILVGLFFQFLLLTLLCSLGGALGARLMPAAPRQRD
jgi:hypothetical protein